LIPRETLALAVAGFMSDRPDSSPPREMGSH
jgi:hypothetical protein